MKIAVITGASSGMGREFVRQLDDAQKFDEMWLIARRKERLEELKTQIDTPIRAISLDLSKEESIKAYESLLEEEKPEIKVLVNGSGYGKFGAILDIPLSEQLGMVDLNSKALLAMTYVSLPYMKSNSEIYEIDSLSAFQPIPYIGVYAATKAFVLSFTRSLNAELRGKGIRAMAICPGWVKTEFFDRAVTDSSVITYYNRFFTAEEVVNRALRDMKKGKDVSICGFTIRFTVFLTKILPHRLVMKIWLKQQGKK